MTQPVSAQAGSLLAGASSLGDARDLVLDIRAAAANSATVVRRYGARLGDFRFLLGAGLTTELLAMQTPARLPLSPQELVGVINVRGTLAPLFDLTRLPTESEAEAPLHHDTTENRMMVLVRAGQDAFAVVIDGFLRTLVDPQPVADAQPPQLPAALQPYIGAAWQGDGAVWYEFDLAALLEHRAAAQTPRDVPARVI